MGNNSAWELTYTTDACIPSTEQECSGVMQRGSHCESRKDWTEQRAPVAAKDNLKEVIERAERRNKSPGSYRYGKKR